MSITMIGLDTAKSVFQVHGVDGAGQVVIRRKLHREELLTFFEKQGAWRGLNTGYSLSRVDVAGSGDGTLTFSGAVRDGSMCWRSSEAARE